MLHDRQYSIPPTVPEGLEIHNQMRVVPDFKEEVFLVPLLTARIDN